MTSKLEGYVRKNIWLFWFWAQSPIKWVLNINCVVVCFLFLPFIHIEAVLGNKPAKFIIHRRLVFKIYKFKVGRINLQNRQEVNYLSSTPSSDWFSWAELSLTLWIERSYWILNNLELPQIYLHCLELPGINLICRQLTWFTMNSI